MDEQATTPMDRRAGVLAHLSSVPGSSGSGNFGGATHRFLDWCEQSGLTLWQVLPLGPPGLGGSPYTLLSAFAGSPRWYAESGAITLEAAWREFERGATHEQRTEFERYTSAPERAWLEDWALYAALKERFEGLPWMQWGCELRRRDPAELERAGRELAERIRFHRFVQFAVDRQALEIRAACESRGILWLGDLPFYVALDSADVWAHRRLFRVDQDGRPAAVAGVPPDDYSAEGQRWNNPLFDWSAIAADGYRWWIDRARACLRWVHAARLDHFRGYEAYWEIPTDAETAANGRWVGGPAAGLFDVVREAGLIGSFLAEDLGEITPSVEALRDRYEIPGMHVLQFGLEDAESPHHPGRHRTHAMACTGTHDNDTFDGWFASLDDESQRRVAEQLGGSGPAARRAVELCWSSPSAWAVAPLQDLFELGSAARMNRPGVAEGQWNWRANRSDLTPQRAERLRRLAVDSNRL